MIEILPKFRGFLKNRNYRMVEINKINFQNKYIEYLDKNSNNVIVFFNDIVLSQYSNCFDVKGKEIASGDIVEINKKQYEVVYNKGCFKLLPILEENEEAYYLEKDGICKIIGNKYKKGK